MSETIRNQSMRVRVVRWGAYAGVPVVALLVAYLATRDRAPADAATHQQSHAATTSASSTQVMLTPEQARRIGVTYAVASLAQVEREIRTVGQITYDETLVRTVSLKIDGWVEALSVNFTGQAVSAGTPLLSVYSPMLVTAQEELLLAKRLTSDVNGGTEDARANASSLLNSARRRLEYWDISAAYFNRIEATGQVQRALTLRSPYGGFVVEKNVLQGTRVMAGEPLYRIADLSTVWVEGEVFERDLSAVRVGQQVSAQIDALPGQTRTGRITYVYPSLNSDTRTGRVRIELRNPGTQLKPGMYATLTWQSSASAPALTVPRTSVIATGQRNLVFVKRRDGMLEPRAVDVASASGDRTEILSGLLAGDTVVTSATFLVDAESNLSTLLGGMGDMPGMDLSAPKKQGGDSAKTNH